MPAPVIDGLITFMQTQLAINVWDGETPRFDTSGNPISPSTVVTPPVWPVVNCKMTEGGLTRSWTFLDPYHDLGEMMIQIWAIKRVDVQTQMGTIEALWASVTNWRDVVMAGNSANPFYVIQMLLERWTIIEEENVRMGQSQLLYRGDMHYKCQIHGAISTS